MAPRGWNENQRHYQTPSRSTYVRDGENVPRPLFHDGHEPFLAVLYANHHDRWVNQLEWLHENPDAPKIPDKSAENKGWPIWHSLYTDQEGGQQKYGGWSTAGIAAFNTFITQHKEAKYVNGDGGAIKPEWDQFEQTFLAKLQQDLGLAAVAPQKGKKRKRSTQQEEMVQPLGMDFDF